MEENEKGVKYTFDFKKQMVLEQEKQGYCFREIRELFGVPKTTMKRWMDIYQEEGLKGLEKKHKGNSNGSRPKFQKTFKAKKDESILQELERLRAENAYLKKLNALVQERQRREKRPKQSGS
jgi:transposase-like protein